MERRLAAILAADVVGYSRLMGENEAGTVARLEHLTTEVLGPLILRHHGRVVKLMGDGFLVEVGSVVDALECAIGWQAAANTQAELGTEDRAMRFRIGLNLGDVIVKGDDVYGDGVNVAARLEALADPGEILVSRTVADHVKGKIAHSFEDLGVRELKNISEPTQVFRVVPSHDAPVLTAGTSKNPRPGKFTVMVAGLVALVLVIGGLAWQRPWAPREEPASIERMAFALPDKPSIAVLPFANFSEDPTQEYFSDGMTEDLITDLSKISGLFVISRNSTFSYKGKQVKVRQVAEELGVRYVLEGSVRRAGDQVRINAQLIDATTGGHLWAERYDGSNADVFALQDKVTQKIVNALALTLTPQDVQSVSSVETSNADAHDAYLLGLSFYHRRTPSDNAAAKTHFEKAIELDPNYSAAYVALAKVFVRAMSANTEEYSRNLGFSVYDGTSKPWKYLQKARAKPDKDYFLIHSRLALKGHQLDRAIANAERALSLNSNDAEAMEALAEALIFSNQPKAGIGHVKSAIRQNPTQLGRPLYLIGLAEFALGNNEATVESLNRAIELSPNEPYYFSVLAAAYGDLGQTAKANAAVQELIKGIGFKVPLHWIMTLYPFSDSSVLDRFANGLKIAGLPVRSGEFLRLNKANRLTGSEIETLLFGKKIEGRKFTDGNWEPPWGQQRTADGIVKHVGYNIQPGVRNGDTGTGRIEKDMLCQIWPKLAKDVEICVAVYRIPERIGRIRWGDYVMLTVTGPHPFSLAE